MILRLTTLLECLVLAGSLCSQPTRPELPVSDPSGPTLGSNFEIATSTTRYRRIGYDINLGFQADGEHIVVELNVQANFLLKYNWRTGELVDAITPNDKRTDLATFEYPRLKEGDHSIRIDYDSGRKMVYSTWVLSPSDYLCYVSASDLSGRKYRDLKTKDLRSEKNALRTTPIPLWVDNKRPVFAFVESGYGLYPFYTNVVIYDLMADTVICRLKSVEDAIAMKNYLPALEKYRKDSADFATAASLKQEKRIAIRPWFVKAAERKIAAMEAEGWRLEKRVGLFHIQSNGSDTGVLSPYRVQVQPGRMYTQLFMTCEERLSLDTYTWLRNDQSNDLARYHWGGSLFSYLDEAAPDTLLYKISNIVYVQKAQPAHFYLETRCSRCQDPDPLPADPVSIVAIFSKPAMAVSSLTPRSFSPKPLQVVNLEKAGQPDKGKEGRSDPEDPLAAEKTDSVKRKAILASLKKRILRPGVKLQEEVFKFEAGDEEWFRVPLNYPPYLKRMVYVINGGNDNEARFKVDMEGLDEMLENEGVNPFNANGYSISNTEVVGPAMIVWIQAKNRKAATYSVLVFTQRDDAGYTKMKAALGEASEASQKAREANRNRLIRENADNREKIQKVRTAAVEFQETTAAITEEMLAVAEKRGWGINQYIDRFNKVKEAFGKLINVMNANRPTVSSGNPDAAKVQAWVDNFTTQYNNIHEVNEKLDKQIKDDDATDINTFRFAFDRIIRYARLISSKEYN